MTISVTVTDKTSGAVYSYPAGPMMPDYFVLEREDGRVVFHLGILADISGSQSTAVPRHLGAHHVKMVDAAGKVLLDADIPGHWWNAQWTYRSAPVALVDPDTIVARNRMFPMGDIGVKVAAPPNYAPFLGPMDSAWITKYMPTTGERPDIGLVTDASAYYLLKKTPAGMLAAGFAAGSCPLHFRHEKTDRSISLMVGQYPQAEAYDGPNLQGPPWLPKGPPNAGGYATYGDNWRPQQAHLCEMSYMAHMASGDMGFLEDLQHEANFVLIDDGAKSKQTGAIISGEPRGLAWGFRQLFMARVATADAEALYKSKGQAWPTWLHPSSYYQTLLDNARIYYSAIMTDPTQDTFRLIGGGYRFGPWQVDYTLAAIAFGILTGHSEWVPLFMWAFKNIYDRTSNSSGFPPGWGGAYYLNTCPWVKLPNGSYDQNQFVTSQPFIWYNAFLFQQNDPNGKMPTAAEIALLKADPLNAGKPMTGAEYLMATRGVLVMAKRLDKLGLAPVRETYPLLDDCVKNVNAMVASGGGINARQSYSDDATLPVPPSSPPPVTPPPVIPPVTPPPTEEPPVTDTPNPISALTAAVHAVTDVKDKIAAAIQHAIDKITAVASAATASGTQVDPAQLAALTAELQADVASLTASANTAQNA